LKEVKIYTAFVAPLDWGLGHAARCVPVIRLLYSKGYEVIIATDGMQKQLLQQEFPTAKFVTLKGYGITYGTGKFATFIKLLTQIPKIFSAIKKEHQWLSEFVKEQAVDIIISDNRYGFYHKNIKSVIITHQLNIITNNSFTEWLARKVHYRLINKFHSCWVPDYPFPDNLAGRLSNPKNFPKIHLRYVGWLVRLNNIQSLQSINDQNEFQVSSCQFNCITGNQQPATLQPTKDYTLKSTAIQTSGNYFKYDVCIILSGPEPQRTILEKNILYQIKGCSFNGVLVRGLPDAMKIEIRSDNFIVYNHLPGNELTEMVLQSKYVICRGGYTSLMEMISLQKKLILVPTPAQTEQEYLAKILMEKNWAVTINQKDFDLISAIEQADKFDYKLPEKEGLDRDRLLEEALIQIS